MNAPDRRTLFRWLAGFGGALAAMRASAHHTDSHFDDDSIHHIVYQCNKADNDYFGSILFSAGEILRKYSDDAEIVVSCFGPGLHPLGRNPGFPVAPEHQDRASSLAAYGVAFHACGNTMTSLGWGEEDLLPFSKIVTIGADDIMLLQEKGFAYLAW